MTLVSVLTPSLNQGRWLRDNIVSVRRQSYRFIEHVIMDGGSSDDSVAILGQCGYPGLVWRSERDRGQSQALNKALVDSQGEIIGWLNSDDAYYSTTTVEDVVRQFEANADVDVIYGHAAIVNAKGLLLQMIWVPPPSYKLMRLYNFVIQPAAFVRRSALVGGFANEDYDYCMDRELWLRLGQRHHFLRLDKVLAVDRHHLQRKAFTRRDVLVAETRRLSREWRIPMGAGVSIGVKALKVAMRLLGLSLIGQGSEPLAFEGYLDSRFRLMLRQLLVPRAAMPPG